jgi:hypothetical protein
MPEEPIIRWIPGEELPGALRKQLAVPEGSQALLVDGEEVRDRRAAGEYRLGNWPRPAPDVVLLSQQPFDVHPRLQRLKSGDGKTFDLVWPLTVQISDPARFYQDLITGSPDPEMALLDLEDRLAGLLVQSAQNTAEQHAMDDLTLEEQVQSSLRQAMAGPLRAALSNLGLTLVGSQRPQPRTLADEEEALASMNLAARAARDARFEALFQRLEDKEMLAYRLAEFLSDQGQPPPDERLVDLLWQVVEQGPEEAAVRAQQAMQAMDRQVTSLRMTLQSDRSENQRRFQQLMARLESTEKAARTKEERDPVQWVNRLLWILRVVGTVLTLTAAAVAILAPQMELEYEQLSLYALIAGGAVAALTLFSDLFLRRKVRQLRQQAAGDKLEESRASLKRRREADRLVRARVESSVKQIADSLEAAWKKGYSAGGAARELAVQVRQVAQAMRDFGEGKVPAANYSAGRYLAQADVPDDHLAAMLDLDGELLARGQALSQAAESLYAQVNDGQVEAASAGLRELDKSFNTLRNRFTEREAYLSNRD